MNVALIGATGNIGTAIRKELLSRGHTITAISRKVDAAALEEGVEARQADMMDVPGIADALAGHDAVVSAAMFIPGSSARFVEGLCQSGVKRAVIVGGAGSLDAGGGKLVADVIEVPDEWRPAIAEGVVLLDTLRKTDDLDWTFVSPPAMIGPGERTGRYRTDDNRLVVAEDGKSSISYPDYAIAIVDALEKGTAIRNRFAVGY